MTARLFLILLLVLGGMLVTQVDAETFTFLPSSGVWNDPDNWEDSEEQPGIPEAGDTAIIPEGKTCTIDADEAEAQIVNVESFSILYITQGAKLTIYDGTAEDCTITGLISFIAKEGQSDPGEIHCYNNVSFAGGGNLYATSGVKGRLTSRVVSDVPTTLTVAFNNVIQGYFDLEAALVNNGEVRVGGSGDVMRLMSHPKTAGSSAFWIAEGLGKIQVDAEVSGTGQWQLDVNSTGNPELEINATCTDLDGYVRIGGGTMDVNASFCTTSDVEYYGGTINVASAPAGVTATFGGTCP
jgi:hypothetical protein